MKISEIQPGMMGLNVKGKITDIGEVREVNTRFGTQTTVATATLSDDSGQVKLTLWGDQISKVKVGSEVEIVNGMSKEWQGEIQVSVGKRGELKVK
jgi:replication factor A1